MYSVGADLGELVQDLDELAVVERLGLLGARRRLVERALELGVAE